MKTMTVALVLAAASIASGCGSKAKAKAKTVPTDPNPGPTATAKKATPVVEQDQQVTPGLAISPDILSACGIKAIVELRAAAGL